MVIFGYIKKSRGFKFHDSTTKNIFDTGNGHLVEDIRFAREIMLETFSSRKNMMLA